MTMRLNKYIAHHAGLSRREADAAIEAGRISVNGVKAQLGAQVSPEDVVIFDNSKITESAGYTYIALHKPVGYVSSRKPQGDSATVYSLLPPKLHHLKPVGRLDKDSSGLLLLTDDGDFAHQMTHPSFYKSKVYEVTIDTPLAPLHHQMINDHGIQLDDGNSKLSLERLSDDGLRWRVTMHEGRNRQIRRTFAALGYTVTKLHRTQFGNYRLDNLPTGKITIVSK